MASPSRPWLDSLFALEKGRTRPSWRRSLAAFCVVLLGLLLAAIGVASIFVGGYLLNGEAHRNLREGLPLLAFGIAALLAGFIAVFYGVRNLRRVARSAAAQRDG